MSSARRGGERYSILISSARSQNVNKVSRGHRHAITDVNVDTLTKISYSSSAPSFSQIAPTPNTFCQLDLAASASHNTASFDFGAVAVDAAAGPSELVVRAADSGCGGATSSASANPPPTCSSSRAIATFPLSRELPPDRMTSSCSHAARCISTIEICSPARDKRGAMRLMQFHLT